ncbi:MAG: hypothetical protein KF866_07480 [Phycisphaeraceae bacterium]|nr:hypothetical protein [Phycisphaeraceae bacterium]
MALTTLFLDFNSYFASVEQHLRPSLRGQPLVVTPMLVPSACCIATSIEAKRFGVTTGMTLAQAQAACPQVIAVRARHRAYIDMHHRLIGVIESCLPVDQVHSVDEVSCRLSRSEQSEHAAIDLAERIKTKIASEVGESLRCSIGLATNRVLAKLATDLQKPDGLVVIRREDLPDRLLDIRLTAFPGIGARTAARLAKAGITDVAGLHARSICELESAWGSVLGRHWWHWIRGEETERHSRRYRSMGHQHVLGPRHRNDAGAWEIAVRLLTKAAARMRRVGYWATGLGVSMRLGVRGNAQWWEAWASLEGGCRDTLRMLRVLARVWAGRPAGTPLFVGVTLTDLMHEQSVTTPLFAPERASAVLSDVIDRINERFGFDAIFPALLSGARRTSPGGIAFSSVPNAADFPLTADDAQDAMGNDSCRMIVHEDKQRRSRPYTQRTDQYES